MFALKQASRLRVSLLQCFCLVRAMLLASSATAPMPREGCRDNTPSSVRRSCTHSKHALLSRCLPGFSLFQGPDGSDTHLIESASCTRITPSSWRSRPARCVFRSSLPFHRLQSEC